jgi:hypothetical protein
MVAPRNRRETKVKKTYPPTNYEVIAAKAQALADAAKNWDATATHIALRDLDALLPYFRQDVLHHDFNDKLADALRRDA